MQGTISLRVAGRSLFTLQPLYPIVIGHAALSKTTGPRIFSIALFEDLSNNPPSRGGTELLNPSTRLSLQTYIATSTPHHSSYPSLLAAYGNPGYRYTSSWLPISSRTISFLVTRSVRVMR